MPHHGTKTEFELTTIERLKQLYGEDAYCHGADLDRDQSEVVLRDVLQRTLKGRYPDLPEASLEEAVRRFSRPEGADARRLRRCCYTG